MTKEMDGKVINEIGVERDRGQGPWEEIPNAWEFLKKLSYPFAVIPESGNFYLFTVLPKIGKKMIKQTPAPLPAFGFPLRPRFQPVGEPSGLCLKKWMGE